jgi:hypothetical protein
MTKQRWLVALGLVLGFIFCVIGYVYSTRTAGSLPPFFPGYAAGSTATHVKHSIASFIVGIACFVFAWFEGGPTST